MVPPRLEQPLPVYEKSALRSLLQNASGTQVFLGASAIILLYGFLIGIHRVYFSPLSHIPGPKIAAFTWWYEAYYDVIKRGQYVDIIKKMHEKYGPIVRINPIEISIDDPSFYNEVYVASTTRRTTIDEAYRGGLAFDGAHVMTGSHELHKKRRKPLEPFFSRRGIERVESWISGKAKLLETKLQALNGTGNIVRMDHAFSAYAGDIVGGICCEETPGFLDHPEFAPDWHGIIDTVVSQIPTFMHFTFLVHIVRFISVAVGTKVLLGFYPAGAGWENYRANAVRHIELAKRENLDTNTIEKNDRSSVFRHLISSDIPQSEKSTERLSHEAMIILGAGTVTTARTLSVITFYVLSNPHIKARLSEELSSVMQGYPSEPPRWSDLEKLPYLQACIKEGLRISPGALRRLPRCSPDVALQYKQYAIPRHTPVGMSSYYMHYDPITYPDPSEYRPERWLGDYNPHMNRNFVPFTRGSRNCIGMNVAYAMMFICVGTLFRPGGPDMRLFQTDASDVKCSRDLGVPMPKADSNGLRVSVGCDCTACG